MSRDKGIEEIADADLGDLSDEELMLAIGAYAQRKGEAEARREHVGACVNRRRSGLRPLWNVVRVTSWRLSLRYVESMGTSATETAAERNNEFQDYLTEATAASTIRPPRRLTGFR